MLTIYTSTTALCIEPVDTAVTEVQWDGAWPCKPDQLLIAGLNPLFICMLSRYEGHVIHFELCLSVGLWVC